MAKAFVNIYDKDGNQVGTAPMGQNGVTGEQVNNEYQKVYRAYDDQGKSYYTSTMPESSASISLDKDTGKINISAPQAVLDDPSFGEVFNENILKQYSSAYQRNPDYKVADPFDESNGSKDITIPEIIEKYDQEIKKYVTALNEEASVRKDIADRRSGYSNRNDIANRLTRDDMIVMSTNALGEGANDDSLISIPKSMYADVSSLESFDAEKGTVKKGEFREKVFSLINKDEDYINSIYNRLEDYLDEDDFEDTDEYARVTALYSFVLASDPDMTPIQNANYVVSSFFKGLGLGLSEIGKSVETLMSGGDEEFIAKEYEGQTKYREESEKFLSRMSTAGGVALNVGSFGGEILPDIVLSVVTGGAAAELAAASMLAKVGRIAGIVGKAGTITEDAVKVAKAASSLESVASMTKTATTLAATAKDLTTGADMLLAANTASEAAKIASKAATTVNAVSKAYTVTDVLAQSVVEAALTDPVVMGKVLQTQERDGVQSGKYDDAYGKMLETAAWNTVGWGAFTVGAKGMKKITTTKVGRYTNAVAQKYLNKLSVATGTVGEKLLKARYGEEYLTASKNDWKNQAREANYKLRQAQKVVASQKIGMPLGKNAGKNVRQQELNIINLMAAHNVTDSLQRGASSYIRRKLDAKINPVLSGFEQRLRTLGAQITKLEKEAGLVTRKRFFRTEAGGTARVFSKESANYIGAKTQLTVLENIERVQGGLDDAQRKGKEILEKMLAESEAKLGTKLTSLLDEYLDWDRKFWQEYNNLRMAEGSLSVSKVEELRKTGYWGENGELYRPTYRVQPEKETKLVRTDNKVKRDIDTGTDSYQWGSDKDFMDPELARYSVMMDAGNTLNATRYVKTMNSLPFAKAHVAHNAEDLARVARMKEVKTPLGKRIKDVTKGVFSEGGLATGDAAARSLRLAKMRSAYVKLQTDVVNAKIDLGRVASKKIKTTISERRTAVESMSEDQLNGLLSESALGSAFDRMQGDEEFKILWNTFDKETKDYIRGRMENMAGVLYPAEAVSSLEAAIRGESTRGAVAGNAPYITAKNYNKLARYDVGFVAGVKKSYVKGNKDLRDSEAVTKLVEDEKRAALVAEREGLYKENLAKLNQLKAQGLSLKDQDAILREFDEGLDEYLDTVFKDEKLTKTIDDIIKQSGTKDKDAAREYIVLEEMLRDDSQAIREVSRTANKAMVGDKEAYKGVEQFERDFLDKVAERRNIARQKLADEGSSLVDQKSWLEEIRKLDKEISDDLSQPGYVPIPNAQGEMEIWEVDPIVADLYTYGTQRPDMSAVQKFFNETSKIFRLGTTGMNVLSFVNQSFRDFGNLWLTSGSYHMINLSRRDIASSFGEEIVEHYLREEPEVYEQLLKQAERQGKEVEDLLVERELAQGRQISTQATETAFLKRVGDAQEQQKIQEGSLSRMSRGIDRAVDALGSVNERRERYFRNITFSDSLNQALKRGYDLKSARIQAEFMMNNATTNFSRQMVHLRAMQRTVPYLGAAINGTKSFFRIMSVDPVGVMSRLMGGFVIPVMAFTGLALADPEARKKYEQLSEYEKDNNIIINVGGQLMKIPIPQEIGSLVKPWQHLVEKMHDSNRHDFWELMLNDAIGVSPLDITGFYDLDQDAMENPNIWDRLENGATQLIFGQMATPAAKAAYIAITGKDPYTGKFVDTSDQYYDQETGEVVTMDSSTSAFGNMIAKNFGGSAGVAAAIVTALAGRTGMNIVDSLTSMGQFISTGGEEGSLTTLVEKIGEEVSKPITVADYDRTKTAWNREISARYREKVEILNSEKYQKIEQAINQETDPDKLRSLKAQRQDMLQDWYDRTEVAIDKLQTNFGGTIDRYRMASLISLLNMHESSGGISARGRAANDELYYEGRDEAIRALIDMGADETGDRSMLGYMTTVKENDGSEHTEVKFYKPLEILAMQNAWYSNASVSKAYIQELVENGDVDLSQEIKQVKKLRQQIYDKGKLSQADYANITALELEWNARVMTTLAPYFERVTPESAINDEEVMEYLDDLILVPSEFKKDKRGYYVTNKSLGDGSAKDAYIKNYIRSIFGINDTGYSSGKNYSGRQALGGQ